ncbi:Protein hunchback [Harpegnathos saltator]|uniref:Protein hunchback n=1 Tax=Harpegnathos saltator TaxID=610380 RepID=E2BZD5_HARSA|nr:Protein hunchback [Harpegnathos saltator]
MRALKQQQQRQKQQDEPPLHLQPRPFGVIGSWDEIVQHLTEHVVSRNNTSSDIINMALAQLKHLHDSENRDLSSRDNDSHETNSCIDEPGVRVPRVNSQGKMKTFPCKNCDFKAVTKLEYWGHIRIHIKPGKLMSCYKCPFVTEYKHHLEYHLLNHTGAKPYKCPTCSYTCVNKSMLNSHMKSHSSIYQYRCKDCEYATKYCHTLKQHLRKYRHQPAAVLNADGTLSPVVIDVYDMFNSRRKDSNLTAQKDHQAEQETVIYPYQYHHHFFNTLNIATQQLLPNGFVLGDTTQTTSTAAPNDEVEQQDTGDTAEQTVARTPATSVAAAEFFEASTAEQLNKSGNVPLDLTSSSLRNEATGSNNQQLQCQQAPLNLASSPRVAGTRRRKGVAVKLEYRVVEKEEDTDEEQIQNEKKLCQSTSPTAASAPSTSFPAASAPSTSPMAASTPSTSFMAASGPSTTLTIASTQQISSVPECDASGAAEPSQRCEDALTHSEPSAEHDRYVCLYCDIPYPDRKIYIAHMRYHDDTEPFTCVMCGKSYGNRAKFNLHIYEKKCVNHRQC